MLNPEYELQLQKMAELYDLNVIRLYPWSISATEAWDIEGLTGLREFDATRIVEAFAETDVRFKAAVIFELVAHGNRRKAAHVLRLFMKKDVERHNTESPKIEQVVARQINPQLVRQLLRSPLSALEETPQDFAWKKKVTFIQ